MVKQVHRFGSEIVSSDGDAFVVHAYAAPQDAASWAGWLVFVPVAAQGPLLTTERETTQPNLQAVEYWATGLSQVYLEGALERARTVGTTNV